MSSLKIGRNDPCPCGSGKKYKKCCGVLGETIDITLDPFTRYSQLLAAIKLKLDEHYGQRIKKMRKDFKEHFLRFTAQPVLPQENESLYSEWLWFAAQAGEHPALGLDYLLEHGEYMDTPLRGILEALNHSYLSVYKVLRAEHQYLEVQDIFCGETKMVMLKEPWEVEINANPPLLLGRLVQVEQECLFSGMVLIASSKSEEEVFLKSHVNFLCSLYGQAPNDFLLSHQEIVYGLFDHALKQIMVTFDHMEAAQLGEKERITLLDALILDPQWESLHNTQGYQWFCSRRQDNYGYMRIAVGEKDLVWAAEILEDIEYVRTTLRAMLPGIISTIINNRFKESSSNDFFALWFLIVRDREAEQWLQTPHIELDNQTPAQLMNEEEGRVRLQAMLSEFILSDSSSEGKALLEYMQERITLPL